jgi:hypothetical protein
LEKPINVPDFPGQVRQFLTGNPADE